MHLRGTRNSYKRDREREREREREIVKQLLKVITFCLQRNVPFISSPSHNDVCCYVVSTSQVHNERNKNRNSGHSCKGNKTVGTVTQSSASQSLCNSLQQTMDTDTRSLVVTRENTSTSFWNMSRASAPIRSTATSVK